MGTLKEVIASSLNCQKILQSSSHITAPLKMNVPLRGQTHLKHFILYFFSVLDLSAQAHAVCTADFKHVITFFPETTQV